jgi:hypothetical protein
LANFTTLASFSVSVAISRPKSEGEPDSVVPPSSTSRALILGSASAALISLLSLSTIAVGVQVRQRLRARRRGDRECAQPAGTDVLDRRRHRDEQHLNLAADDIGQRRRAAAVRYMHHPHSGHQLEQLAREMIGRAGAARRHVDAVGIGLGIGDELGDRRGRDRRVDHHHIGDAGDAADRRDVADEHEIELVVK